MKEPAKTTTQAETTTPADGKHSFNWGGWCVWSFVILVLYTLSFGPVAMLLNSEQLSRYDALVVAFYRPAIWVYDDTPLHKPLQAYLHWWDPANDNQ